MGPDVENECKTKPESAASALSAGLGAVRGHYFGIKRGEYYRDRDGKTVFVQAGGLSYVGGLTRTQRDELDAIIRAYVVAAKEAPNV